MKKITNLAFAACCLVVAGAGIAATAQDAKPSDCCSSAKPAAITVAQESSCSSTPAVAAVAVAQEAPSDCCASQSKAARIASLTTQATENCCSATTTKALFAALEDISENCSAECEVSSATAIGRLVAVMAEHNIKVTFSALEAPAATTVSLATPADAASSCCSDTSKATAIVAAVTEAPADCCSSAKPAATTTAAEAKSDCCSSAKPAATTTAVAAQPCPFGQAADEYITAIMAVQKQANVDGCCGKIAVEALLMTIAQKDWYKGDSAQSVFASMFAGPKAAGTPTALNTTSECTGSCTAGAEASCCTDADAKTIATTTAIVEAAATSSCCSDAKKAAGTTEKE